MIEILQDTQHENVIGIKVSGALVHADYEKFVPMLEEIIAKHGKLRCYFEMHDFHGVTPRAIWDETKFDVKHCKDIERCAVVGEKKWLEWMTKFSTVIFRSAELRYFDVSEKEQAWEWIGAEKKCSCGCACHK